MKFELMIKILFELLSKKCVKASYLAEKYGVSVRSIYRYISELEIAGVPIYTNRGREGGFSIMDTFKLSSTFLTKDEFNNTIDVLSAITKSVPNKNIESVINKLKSSIKNDYSSFNISSGNLIIDAGPWGDTVGYKAKLSIIQKAMEEKKQLQIKYHDRNASPSERIINPHTIVFKQGLWYVFAYCTLRNEFRFFKTGRIEYAKLLDSSFERIDISKMELPLNFWENSVLAEEVTMQIDKKVLSDVEEWLGIENVKEENGKFIANAKLPYDNGLVSKIISFGSGIKVLSPISLKEEVKKVATEIYNNV